MGDEAYSLDDGADYVIVGDECPVTKCKYNEDGYCINDIYARCPYGMD